MKLNKNIKITLIKICIPLLAVVLSFLIGTLVILISGGSPIKTFMLIFTESFTTGYGFGQVLQKTTQLIFTGLAVAIAFRCGLFNIGAEGQMTMGAFVIGVAGTINFGLPPFLTPVICIFAGMSAGAVWGGIPGYLKARFGSHEVITTIMLNFIALALVNWFIEIPGMAPLETVHTYQICESAYLPQLSSYIKSFAGSTANLSLFIGIFSAICLQILLLKTRFGFEIRSTGLNKNAAVTYGVDVKKTIVASMMISGALAALAGADFVLGYKHYFELNFSSGIGFMGIAVALLAENNPIAVIPSALLFGSLAYGRIILGGETPKEIIDILQAAIILLLVIFTAIGKKIIKNINS